MSGLKRKPQGGSSLANLPNISGFPTSVQENVIYDFGDDSEGFYKVPFFDGEEGIWKQLAFKDFAKTLKGALNIKYFGAGTSNLATMTDTFLFIRSDYDQDRIVFPREYFFVPKILHTVNFCESFVSVEIGYINNDDEFIKVIDSYYLKTVGLQSHILAGGLDTVFNLSSNILSPQFFEDSKYFIQSANIKVEANPNTTDEFLRIPIFDWEERNYKFTNLPSLSEGLGLGHLRNYREYILRNSSTYNIPIQPKELTRIILHEGCATQQINLAIDNVNLDFDAFEGTEIEVINFKNNIKTFIWGSQGTATTAFTVPASTTNNAVGVSRRFILLDTMWRQV